MNPSDTSDSYAIVFSGGGALGSWGIGCYKAILSRHKGIQPSIVTGASSGGLNAAGILAGMSAQELEKLWSDLRPEHVYKKRYGFGSAFSMGWRMLRNRSLQGGLKDYLSSRNSFFDTQPLYDTLAKIFHKFAQPFMDSRIQLAISLTNLTNGTRQLFYKLPPGTSLPSGIVAGNTVWQQILGVQMLLQALMGTTALPILFPPFQGYFDGGVLLNQPISPAIDLGAVRLYVLIPSAEALGVTTDLRTIGSTLLSTWLSRSLLAQIESVKLRNKIRALTGSPKLEVCVIRPPVDLENSLGVGLLSFGQNVKSLTAQGEQDATARMNRFDPANENTWY